MTAELEDDAASVLRAIRQMALKRGRAFTLASGRTSDYFLDMKPVLNDAATLLKIARLLLERIPGETDAVGGLAMGSIPISTAIIILRNQKPEGHKPLRSFWVRPEEKQHGLGGIISGVLDETDKVVIVDDVTTTGRSIKRAVDAVQSKGAQVLKVISVVDRQEGAAESFAKVGIPFESLFRRIEILGR